VSCDLVPGKEGPTTHSNEASLDVNLRLIWPQWQGGGTPSVQEYASDFPFDVASRGYAVGRQSSKQSCHHTMARL
jgi:hypothetical protein